MIEDGILVAKDGLSSLRSGRARIVSKGSHSTMDLHTLPRPSQPASEPHRHRTSHALIAITYANEDGTKEEGRAQ
jgi:hypothetical protein